MHSTEIATTAFSTTKFREGYAMPEVDQCLEHVRQSLSAWEAGHPGTLTAEAMVQLRFTPTKFRTGYDQDEVDTFLDDVGATLGSFESRTQL